MWYNKEHPAYNLPDVFAKDPNSNNYKILEIVRRESVILRGRSAFVESILDISNASGKTLDLYGERVGQKRGLATDDQYRVLILARILRNLSNGSYNSVVKCLSMIFNCDPSEIHFEDVGMRGFTDVEGGTLGGIYGETFETDGDDIFILSNNETSFDAKMCTVEIVKLPVDKISQAGFTQKQALAIIKAMLPICISLRDYFVESTFEFAENETTYENDKGFTDVEGGTVGGYFGYLFASEDEPEFPI